MNGVDELRESIIRKMEKATTVDYIQLSRQMQAIEKVASFVIGVIGIVVIVFLAVIVAIELAYINLPTVRINAPDDHAVFGFMFRDAKRALEKSAVGKISGNANLVYMIIKLKVVMCAVVIVLLCTEYSSVLLGVVMDISERLICLFG